MTSANRSTRPDGPIPIPVEFVSESRSHRHFSSSTSQRRFQPRSSAMSAYDRLIRNSQFNQPSRDSFPTRHSPPQSDFIHRTHQRVHEASTPYYSRSNDDLLHANIDRTRPKEHLRRSFDILNDLSDGEQQRFTTKTTKTSRSSDDLTNDQCDAQTDCSDTRPPPSTSNQPQTDENGSTHMDQQVPSNDATSTQPEPDPNAVALEKLEQIQQSLVNFNGQVDAYAGSTRNDRVYKALDEQAVKLMMRCDELVNVNTDIKEKRKEMIRNVQSALAKLESKVPLTPSIDEHRTSMETNVFTFDESKANSSTGTAADHEQTSQDSVAKN